MFPEAFAAYKRELDLHKDKSAGALGEAYERAGYKGYLLKKIQILQQAPQFNMYTSPVLAREYAQLHDEAHALVYLERAYDERYPWLLLLRVAPVRFRPSQRPPSGRRTGGFGSHRCLSRFPRAVV